MVYNYVLRSMDYGLLWGIVAYGFALPGVPGRKPPVINNYQHHVEAYFEVAT